MTNALTMKFQKNDSCPGKPLQVFTLAAVATCTLGFTMGVHAADPEPLHYFVVIDLKGDAVVSGGALYDNGLSTHYTACKPVGSPPTTTDGFKFKKIEKNKKVKMRKNGDIKTEKESKKAWTDERHLVPIWTARGTDKGKPTAVILAEPTSGPLDEIDEELKSAFGEVSGTLTCISDQSSDPVDPILREAYDESGIDPHHGKHCWYQWNGDWYMYHC